MKKLLKSEICAENVEKSQILRLLFMNSSCNSEWIVKKNWPDMRDIKNKIIKKKAETQMRVSAVSAQSKRAHSFLSSKT